MHFCFFLSKWITNCFRQYRYSRQGVVFSGGPCYSFFNDAQVVSEASKNSKFAIDGVNLFKDILHGENKLPRFVGVNMKNDCWIIITDPRDSSQIYTDANKYHSKVTNYPNKILAPTSIFFQKTSDQSYKPKKRVF